MRGEDSSESWPEDLIHEESLTQNTTSGTWTHTNSLYKNWEKQKKNPPKMEEILLSTLQNVHPKKKEKKEEVINIPLLLSTIAHIIMTVLRKIPRPQARHPCDLGYQGNCLYDGRPLQSALIVPMHGMEMTASGAERFSVWQRVSSHELQHLQQKWRRHQCEQTSVWTKTEELVSMQERVRVVCACVRSVCLCL